MLLGVAMVVVLLLATTGALVSFSVSESDVLNRRVDRTVAFLLAEGAIESSKFELAQGVDLAADGLGTISGSNSMGSFKVQTTDLGASVYQLDAAGVGGRGTVVTVSATVEIGTRSSSFPPGGLSLVGELDPDRITLRLNDGFIIDGADGAAVTLSDPQSYDWFAEQFAAAIDNGDLHSESLSGDATNTFTYNDTDYELPVQLTPSYDSRLLELQNTYLDLIVKASEIQEGARDLSNFTGTYGSPETPVIVRVDEDRSVSKETITGYGTLIVSDSLSLSNTKLDWHGNIIVMGSDRAASLSATGSSVVNVTGNLIALGEVDASAHVGVWGGSNLNVDGNLFIGTNWIEESRSDAALDVAGGSEVNVNGVLTMIGRSSEINTDGDVGNNLFVNGMLQVAVPDTDRTSLRLDFDTGITEIHRDVAKIQNAMTLLHDLGVEYDIATSIEHVISSGFTTTKAWVRNG